MFYVKELKTNLPEQSEGNSNVFPKKFLFNLILFFEKLNKWQYVYKNEEKFFPKEAVCRICYEGNDEDDQDLLVAPCQCLGSLKYIHLNCLKSWIKNRATITKHSYGYSYILKNMECELCHMIFPGSYHINLFHSA